MTDQTRPAPYPADTQANGWRFEIDMAQIQRSDTWALASAWQRPWLLMLWAIAWSERPCGSLPDDDEIIAAKIGMELGDFQDAKRVLMRGWWRADDGRLYHDTITERVLDMLAKKEGNKLRKRAQRERARTNKAVTRDSTVTDAGVQRESDTKNIEHSNTFSSLRSEKDIHVPVPSQDVTRDTSKPSKPKRERTEVGVDALVEGGLDEETARQFLAHRRHRKALLTPRAWEGIVREARKAGWPVHRAVSKMMERGWTGFEASWVAGQGGSGGLVEKMRQALDLGPSRGFLGGGEVIDV